MCKVAFSLGPFVFYWYGMIIAVSVLAAFAAILWQSRLWRDPLLPLVDLTLYGIPAGIVCARIFYVFANWGLYRDNPLESLYIWQGGLSISGAMVGFIAVLYSYVRANRLSFWHWTDILAPGLALGEAVGQWANLVSQEAFGHPAGSSWGVYIDYAVRPAGFEQFDFFQPVFGYESAWNMLLFLALVIFAAGQRKYKWLRPGSLFLIYIMFYSLGHAYLTGLRLDSDPAVVLSAQVVNVLLAGVAFVLFVRNNRRAATGDKAAKEVL
jgi:phosphatidylglycerol---prolipoprotein diacylglyceryl transferase